MKLYGLVFENDMERLYVSEWFFSPEDRDNRVKQLPEIFPYRTPFTYEKDYWFIEVDTDKVTSIGNFDNEELERLEEIREEQELAEEEMEGKRYAY